MDDPDPPPPPPPPPEAPAAAPDPEAEARGMVEAVLLGINSVETQQTSIELDNRYYEQLRGDTQVVSDLG